MASVMASTQFRIAIDKLMRENKYKSFEDAVKLIAESGELYVMLSELMRVSGLVNANVEFKVDIDTDRKSMTELFNQMGSFNTISIDVGRYRLSTVSFKLDEAFMQDSANILSLFDACDAAIDRGEMFVAVYFGDELELMCIMYSLITATTCETTMTFGQLKLKIIITADNYLELTKANNAQARALFVAALQPAK